MSVREGREKASVSRVDVARLAGVSRTTVSNVVNKTGYYSDDVKQRVLAAIEELGYRPNLLARSLVSRASRQIAVFVESLGNPYTSDLVSALCRKLHQAGFRSIVVEHAWADMDYVVTLTQGLVDGVILADANGLMPDGDLKMLLGRGLPVVAHGFEVDRGVPTVNAGYMHGMMQVMSHLHQLGHKRVAFIGECRPVCDQRFRWYKSWSVEFGMDQDDSLVAQTPDICPWYPEGGYAGAAELLNRDCGATALVCGNDLVAIGAMNALSDKGYRIPGDMSVVGWDDIPGAAFAWPGLTTLRIDRACIARTLVEALMKSLESNPEPPPLVLGDLVIRKTTAQIRPA